MLKSFGMAVAALALVSTPARSTASPAMDGAGFAPHGASTPTTRFPPFAAGRNRSGFFHRDRGFFHRDRDFFRRDRFRRRAIWFWGWPGWPGYEPAGDLYPSEASASYPPPPAEVSRPPSPPPCPELLHWDPKLGHETREKLCD